MVFFSDVSGLLTSDGGDMGMVEGGGGLVKVISGEVSNGTVISGESPPMPQNFVGRSVFEYSERPVSGG